MGYTHYWTQKRDVTAVTWALICADVRKLIENMPATTDVAGGNYKTDLLQIGAEFDSNEPAVVDADEIRFNGLGDLGHETFAMTRKRPPARPGETTRGFEFCKTDRKPYDLVVCAVLLVVEQRSGHAFRFGAPDDDGDADDWAPAIAWASDVLSRTFTAPSWLFTPKS